MTAILAEARRILAGRAWWISLLIGIALTLLTIVPLIGNHSMAIAAGTGVAQEAANDATRYWMTIYLPGSCVAALAISREFQDDRIKRSVLLHRMNRLPVVWTKLGGVLLIGAGFGAVAAAFASASPYIFFRLYNIPTADMSVDWKIVGGIFIINILAAAWGFGIGIIFRNPMVSIYFLLAQALLVETLGAKAVPTIGRYLLTPAFASLYKDVTVPTMGMLPALGIACLWIIAALTLAVTLFKRRDI